MAQVSISNFVRRVRPYSRFTPTMPRHLIQFSSSRANSCLQSAESSKLQSHVDFLSKQGYLKPDAAAALDKDLMDAGFQLGQLMELAGLSVAQAVLDAYPPSTHPRVFIACGPGNNGGDGLVAARHLQGFGYTPTVYLPKSSAKTEPSPNLFRNLEDTLKLFDIPIVTTFDGCFEGFEVIVDAVFGKLIIKSG